MAGEGLKDLIAAIGRGQAEGRALMTPRAPMLPNNMTPDGRFRLPSAGFSEITSSAPNRSWGVVKPYAVPSLAQPPFGMLDDAAKEAVYSGLQKAPMTPAFSSPSAADILTEARGGGTARVPIQQLLDGIDDTMIRAAAPGAESATSGAFSAFQPGSAGWRSMAQPMTSPWEGSIPMPKDPLAAAPSKVYPGWNAPFGAGSGPIGDGTKISARANLLSSTPERNALYEGLAGKNPEGVVGSLDDAWSKFRAADAEKIAARKAAEEAAQAGASVADDVGATALRAAPGAASAAIEAEAPAFASTASRGMLSHTLDGLRGLKLPWGKIALGGAALGGAAKLLGSLGQVPGYIIPNQMGDGSLSGGITAEPLDPLTATNNEAAFHGAASDADLDEIAAKYGLPGWMEGGSRSSSTALGLPSPEELPGMPEEPEMSMDGDEPPPVTHTAPLEEPSAGLRTIQKGDTLSALLLGMGVPPADLPRVIGEIARGNGLANADQIVPGQQIDMNKRVAGENYRWNGGGKAAMGMSPEDGMAIIRDALKNSVGTPGEPSMGSLIYDNMMGMNRRPHPGMVYRAGPEGSSMTFAPKREPEMPPRFPAGGSRYGR